MKFSLFDISKQQEVMALFNNVFSASEGDEEGQSIANLVHDLITKTKTHDLVGCLASDNDVIVGAIFFSRFIVPSEQHAFILSPVAIASEVQKEGIGQALINYGLEQMKSLNVDLVFTYGDPEYYCKTGFDQISEATVKAPYTLSQPIGWLAQSLDGKPITKMNGTTQCVEALSDQKHW